MVVSRPVLRRAPALIAAAGAAAALGAAAAPASADAAPFRTLLINACDGGGAKCFNGGAVDGTVALVKERTPNVVAMNESCRGRVQDIARRTGYKMAFVQAGSMKCRRNGQDYGNALLVPDGTPLRSIKRTRYTSQAPGREKRYLMCAEVAGPRTACVTHLDHRGRARTQAKQLKRILARRAPVLLAGDLNLIGSKADVAVPKNAARRGDGRRMHVISSRSLGKPTATTSNVGFSDHPVLQVDLAPR